MKGRKPKPHELKLMDGTRKDRINPGAPASPLGLPRCPAHLDAEAKRKWRQLAKDVGWLTKVDGDVVAAYCVAWSRWVAAEKAVQTSGAILKSAEGGFYQNPFLSVANRCIDQLRQLSSLLGLNPVERGRASVPTGSPEDKDLEEFIAAGVRQA